MQQSQWEVVVLKPTAVFYSFLSAQLDEAARPSFELIQYDNTAYVIDKKQDEEATLDEIEKHYSKMFRFEIQRWLGRDAFNEIETSFLDFLCCFKFEFHNQVVFMEESIVKSRQLLCVKPRAKVMTWMREVVSDSPDLVDVLEQVDSHQIVENSTVVIKNFSQLSGVKPFLKKNFRLLFETEMSRLNSDQNTWPSVTNFREFLDYFEIDIHTKLINYSSGD